MNYVLRTNYYGGDMYVSRFDGSHYENELVTFTRDIGSARVFDRDSDADMVRRFVPGSLRLRKVEVRDA